MRQNCVIYLISDKKQNCTFFLILMTWQEKVQYHLFTITYKNCISKTFSVMDLCDVLWFFKKNIQKGPSYVVIKTLEEKTATIQPNAQLETVSQSTQPILWYKYKNSNLHQKYVTYWSEHTCFQSLALLWTQLHTL